MSNQNNTPNILICDDDDVFLDFLAKFVECNGYRPLLATNGDEAIDILKNMPAVTLALIDLLMPVRSGWEVIDYMKQHPPLEVIPIVAITGLAPSPGDLQKVKNICDAVIHKGGELSLDELSATIESLTNKGNRDSQ